MFEKYLPIDEFNALKQHFETDKSTTKEQAIDEVLDLLILAYVYGTKAVNEMFGTDIEPDLDLMQKSIDKEYDGQGFADRIGIYFDENDMQGLALVADTNMHRIFNEAIINTADATGRPYIKRWRTMDDDKVRDTHGYLHGMEVAAGEEFYTYTGAHAYYPGGFGTPQEDCNCRCVVEIEGI